VSELDIQGILAQLHGARVEFVVIGGVAVGFHGYVRATKDLDVVPAPDRPNLERLVTVLRALDAELDGAGEFEASELPDPLDASTLELGGNWVLQTRLGRFDIMQWIGDAELWTMLSPSAVEVEMEGMQVKIAGYDDLVALKRKAARPSDLEDLERLRQARGE
jgi:predicted nucleotidyltransferase